MNPTVKYGLLGMLILGTSCGKKNQTGNPSVPSMVQFIAQTPGLSLVNAAVQRLRLDTDLANGGPYTFFAPSDSALQLAGYTQDSMQTMDPTRLKEMFGYGIVNGRVSGNDIPGFFKAQFTCLHPLYEPFIDKNYYGIFINGIPVTSADHELGDGVVQVIGRVCLPPVGTQLQVLQASKDMRFFAALARQVSYYQFVGNPNPYFAYYANSGSSVYGNTLLVPTDSAFIAFGYPDSTALVADSNDITSAAYGHPGLLVNYVFEGFNFTSDYLGGVIMGPYADDNIGYEAGYYESTLNGLSFIGNGILQTNPPTIVGPDIMGSNGVLQKINQVFVTHP